MKYMYFKKSLSFLIALMLLVGLLPMSALNVLAAGETVVYTVGVGDLAEPTVAEWPSNELTVRGRGFSMNKQYK